MPDDQRTLSDRTFVLHLWREPSEDTASRPSTRLILQDLNTGTRRGFASLDAFLTYLSLVCGEEIPGAENDP